MQINSVGKYFKGTALLKVFSYFQFHAEFGWFIFFLCWRQIAETLLTTWLILLFKFQYKRYFLQEAFLENFI